MKLSRRLLGIGLLGSGIATSGCTNAVTDTAQGAGDVSTAQGSERGIPKAVGRVIVKFRGEDGVTTPRSAGRRARLLNQRAHIARVGGRFVRHLASLDAVAAELDAAQVDALVQTGMVAYVERDPLRELVHPMSVSASELPAQYETIPYGVAMVEGDLVSDANIANRTICLIDTGYDASHEDLRNVPGVAIAGSDADGIGNDTGDWFHDGHGHGTHVAGTLSALSGNEKGVLGITGSNSVGLYIVKAFDDAGGFAYGSDLIAAVEQCVAAGANVINLSLGGGAPSAAEQEAFDRAYAAGVLSIAAAGNNGTTALAYPASYDSVISVAAVDPTKARATFSQRNAQVELAAPGVSVLSTVPGNGYETWDGTSMATPHVAGVAALLWSHVPSCSNATIRNLLAITAEDLGSAGRDTSFGHGLIHAKVAFQYLSEHGCDVPAPPPPPPPPADLELANGKPATGLAGDAASETGFFVKVPSGATDLSIALSGGSGDGDLYVKFGSAPTTASYDCRPYLGGNVESCSFAAPSVGTYYVKVVGYASYANAQLIARYTLPSGCPVTALSASGLPAAIPDNSATGVRASVVSAVTGSVATLGVKATITHTYRGDLVVTLIAPSGASYVLANRSGGSADNLTLDTKVSAANGQAASGTWQLLVQDRAAHDVGTLNSFQLALTPNCN